MKAIARALEAPQTVLPVPWEPLRKLIELEPGFFVLGLAAPGVGKSVFALNWALGLGRPSLFVSTDTDLRTQAKRCYAYLTQEELDGISPAVAKEFLEKQKQQVRWVDELNGVMDLAEIIEAEREFLGQTPALVIVDVVDDLVTEEDHSSYKKAFKVLHRMARKYGTVIFGLHHIRRGEAAKGTSPVSMDDGTFTGEQTAEVVLGLWKSAVSGGGVLPQDTLSVAVLKNRTGRVPPGPVQLRARFEVARIEE